MAKIQAPELFSRIYARHGHRCPMSTLGGRLGLAALARLGGGTDSLQALYGTRTCALDGIAEVTGCGEENGSLSVGESGRHALVLRRGAERVVLEVSSVTMLRAGQYRQLCNRLEQGWEGLDEAERQQRTTWMEDALDELLPYLWQAPDEELFTLLPPDSVI